MRPGRRGTAGDLAAGPVGGPLGYERTVTGMRLWSLGADGVRGGTGTAGDMPAAWTTCSVRWSRADEETAPSGCWSSGFARRATCCSASQRSPSSPAVRARWSMPSLGGSSARTRTARGASDDRPEPACAAKESREARREKQPMRPAGNRAGHRDPPGEDRSHAGIARRARHRGPLREAADGPVGPSVPLRPDGERSEGAVARKGRSAWRLRSRRRPRALHRRTGTQRPDIESAG